jgi:hypothetical protein
MEYGILVVVLVVLAFAALSWRLMS